MVPWFHGGWLLVSGCQLSIAARPVSREHPVEIFSDDNITAIKESCPNYVRKYGLLPVYQLNPHTFATMVSRKLFDKPTHALRLIEKLPNLHACSTLVLYLISPNPPARQVLLPISRGTLPTRTPRDCGAEGSQETSSMACPPRARLTHPQ
jgi:hypothetical protein